MKINTLKKIIGSTDIYLIDQILKNRYQLNEKILDAGCGKGRNLVWFFHHNFEIYAIDKDVENIEFLKNKYPTYTNNFFVSEIENNSFQPEKFHHIICNAVLHFATDESHFFSQCSALVKLLKPNGTLFIRMASNMVLKDKMKPIKNGVYRLPDGSTRFLLTKEVLDQLVKNFDLSLLEPIKSTNVNDIRSMTTLVLKK